MKPKRLAPSLFFILVLLSMCGADNTDTVIRFDYLVPEVILTDFNITPDALNQGETADFSVTIQSLGLMASSVNGTVYIYDSLNALVDSFTYDPVAVGAGATVIVVKTWDSDSLAAGIYTAYVNASYESNVTNTLNASFVIRTIPPEPPSPSSSPSGGAGGGRPKPTPVPPSITPVGDKLRFANVPVVKELLAGEGELESFTLINRYDENLSLQIRVEGLGDWVILQQNATVVLSNSTSIVNFMINVPKNVLSGNYLMKIEAVGEEYYAKDYMLLRVKNYPKWHKDPVYLKTIRTDILEGTTDVSIRLKNPSENSIKEVLIKETIPRSLRTTAMSIGFKNKRGTVENIGGTDVISWKITDLEPLEEMTISYSLSNVLIDYQAYGTWHLRQMDIGAGYKMESLIRIIDLSSDTLVPGSSGDVTATVLYAGEEPIEVTAMLELPSGFYSDPGYTRVVLIPRGLSNINFRITAPKDVSETHLIRAVIMGKDFNVFSSAPVMVKKGSSSIFPGSSMIIGSQGSVPAVASLMIPGFELAVVAIGGALALFALMILLSVLRGAVSGAGKVASGGVGKPRYDFERVRAMGRMKDIISRSIRDITEE